MLPKHQTPIDSTKQHRTARDVAEYLHRGQGRSAGRKYETHGALWNADKDIIKIGFLQLILEELELHRPKEDWVLKHQEWLEYCQPTVLSLVERRKFHIDRIRKMIGVCFRCRDTNQWFSPSQFAKAYRVNRNWHDGMLGELHQQVLRLESVKKPTQITKLLGIGKVTAGKLLSARSTGEKA